jgi:ferrochelatase
MTPRAFLSAYTPDALSQLGHTACESASLSVQQEDVVGIVLLERGGPSSLEDVEPFLYRLLMDPVAVDIPVGGRLRHWLCRSLARLHAGSMRERYRMIGGSSPANRLVREQAHALQARLDRRASDDGVPFRVYTALRHGTPSAERCVQEMIDDGVTCVVLLPLHPHYSDASTGAMLAYWTALCNTGECPDWPTATVCEYAANPKYIQALSERIDEGLQRFPVQHRSEVHLVFSTLGMPDVVPNALRGKALAGSRHRLQLTIDAIMQRRDPQRRHHVAFEHYSRWAHGAAPALHQTLESLAREGMRSVLVVPLAFAADHMETACELDIEMRDRAETLGIAHYEVVSALNSHPLFIEALCDVTMAHLHLPDDAPPTFEGDGATSSDHVPMPSIFPDAPDA